MPATGVMPAGGYFSLNSKFYRLNTSLHLGEVRVGYARVCGAVIGATRATLAKVSFSVAAGQPKFHMVGKSFVCGTVIM